MISDKHKFIYVHIPKCGGTYVTNHLLPFSEDYGRGDIGKKTSDSIMVRRPSDEDHGFWGMDYMHANVKRLHEFMGEEEFQQYFSFATIRNPWERLVSVTAWGEPTILEGMPHNKEEFYNNVQPSSDYVGMKAHILDLNEDFFWSTAPAQHYLLDKRGNLGVDYVFDVSNMLSGLDTVCNQIGIGLGLERRKHNISKHRHYSHYYDNELRDYVAKMYAWEIKTFGYKFEDRR